MYVPPPDETLGEAEWRPFVEAQGFGHFAAAGRGRDVPVVVPTQFVLRGDTVLFHVVGRNPLLAALAENPRGVLSVAGDWAFVPSHFKAIGEEDPLLGIPTTYYAAVQLSGAVEVVGDPEELAALLRTQLGALQPDVAVADPLHAHGAKLAVIRGIRMSVDDVLAKFKYGGNVDAAHRRAVVALLEHVTAPATVPPPPMPPAVSRRQSLRPVPRPGRSARGCRPRWCRRRRRPPACRRCRRARPRARAAATGRARSS